MSHASSISRWLTIGGVWLTIFLASPLITVEAHEYKAPPEPTITHQPSGTGSEKIGPTGDVVLDVDEARKKLHAQHHPHTPIMTRRVPGTFQKTKLTNIRDYALLKGDLDVINPGPGEWVHVMEGQRHGYQNLTIGITYTSPGGAPPDAHAHG